LRGRWEDGFGVVFGIGFYGLRPTEVLEFLVDLCNVGDIRLFFSLNVKDRGLGGFHGKFRAKLEIINYPRIICQPQ
jgi:hypothetical protein